MGRTGLLVAGMFALCVVAQPRVAEVGVDGGTKETSVGTFYAPRAWGQAAVDTDMLRFEVPELEFVMVSDLDKASMYCGTVNAKPIGPDVVPEPPVSPPCDGVALHDRWWLAYLRRGVLQARRPEGSPASGQPVFSVRWLGTTVLRTQSASRGRSMELSDVVRFRHLVLAVCDITGMVWKVRVEDGSVFQRHAVAGGNGEATVPGKLEWATRKDGKLVMGSVGTRMHDEETGAFVHRDSEWVKVLGPNGGIENADWGAVFAALRSAAGVGAGGYLWHEAVEWDPLHRRWLVLPRKRSFTDPYDAELDESKGTNVLLVADEHFRNVTARTVGPVEPEWGFSALRRVPGTDGVLMVLKCREVAGVMRTKMAVISEHGDFLLEDGPWLDLGPVKYEGAEFLGIHPL